MRGKVFHLWLSSQRYNDTDLMDLCEVALGTRLGDEVAAQETIVAMLDNAEPWPY